MRPPTDSAHGPAGLARRALGGRAARRLAHLGLCAAYLQGGLAKLGDFPGAVAEMAHFGLTPAPVFAALVIALELGGSALLLIGWQRWLGALGLAVFTVLATFLALRFWELPHGPARFAMANAFFEHLGLAGGLLLAAWASLQESLRERNPP